MTAPGDAPVAATPAPAWWLRGGSLLVLGLALVAVGALRFHTMTEPLEADEGMYMVMAHAWAQGVAQPYTDLWDTKPIGTFWLYRAGIAVFGYDELTPHLMSLTAALLSTWLLWRLTRGWHWLARVLTPALWVPLTCHVPSYANGANMEVFQVPFILLALLGLRHSQQTGRAGGWYLAMAALAVSLLVKAQTLPFLVLPWAVMPPASWRQWPVVLTRALATAALVLGTQVLAYWASGYPARVALSLWQTNEHYANQYVEPFLPRVAHQLLHLPQDGALAGAQGLLVVAALGTLLAACWWRSSAAWQLGLALGAAITAVVLPGSNHPHYYVLLLPLLALGVGVTAAALPVTSRPLVAAGGVVALVLLALLAGQTWTGYLRLSADQISIAKYQTDWFLVDREVGRRLKALGITNQRVFVDGSHHTVFVYSDTWPANRYFVDWMVLMGVTTKEETVRDLQAKPPQILVILDGYRHFDALRAWATAAYEPIATWPDLQTVVLRRK